MDKLDSNSLKAIQPSEINAYVQSKGWSRVEFEEKRAVWTKKIGETEVDLVVPLRQSFKDYHYRVENILRTLADVEKRECSKLFDDIKHSTSDIIRFRIMHSDIDDGNLPFEGSSKLIEGAKDVLSAAICSIDEKKAFYSRRTNTAMDFLKQLKTAQTERGSFILKIVSPVPPTQQLSFPNKETEEITQPFERQFALNLYKSLAACEVAGTRSVVDNNIDAFTSKVADGINVNILEGLVSLGTILGTTNYNDLEFSINWAAIRDVPEEFNKPIQITRDHITFIQAASRQLKETASLEDYLIQGHVEKLEKTPKNNYGKIVVLSLLEDKYKKVKIELPEKLYNIAIEAHKTSYGMVSCKGDLKKEGRSYNLENPRDFKIIIPSE